VTKLVIFFGVICSIEVLMGICVINKDGLAIYIIIKEGGTDPIFGKEFFVLVKGISLHNPSLVTVILTQIFE